LTVLPMLGAFFIFQAVMKLAAPKKEMGLGAASFVEPSAMQATGFAALNPNGSIQDRIDLWCVKNLGVDGPLYLLHMQLGRPEHPTPLEILHNKQYAVLGLAAFLFVVVDPSAVIFAPIAFFVPDALLNSKVQRRQGEILGNFAQFVDLTALLIESGSDYMTAFDKICKVTRKKTDLELEIEKTIAEVSLGATRKEALRHLADRVGVKEIRSFVNQIITSEELGTSLVGLLRDFATDMRYNRLNKAEKLAAQAATKMLIPLFVFIFPTVFIMMLAPMAKQLIVGGLF
jgi:tight adherence protein C